MNFSRRAIVSLLVYNKDQASARPLLESLEAIEDKRLLSRVDLTFVVYNRNLTPENKELTTRLKRFMRVMVMDAVPESEHPSDELYKKYYIRGHRLLVKKETDTITQAEIQAIVDDWVHNRTDSFANAIDVNVAPTPSTEETTVEE